MHLYDDLTINKGANTGIVALTDGEKKRLLKNALVSSAAMNKLTTEENLDKAKRNPQWSYQFYLDLVKLTALEDDHSTKRTSKTKRTVNAHGTSAGRGRGGRSSTTGRGDNTGRNSQDYKEKYEKMDKEAATKANIPYTQYKTLPNQTKAVIYKDNHDPSKVNAKFGRIITPDNIWGKLSPSAKKAINFHNNNLKNSNTTTSVNNHAQAQQEIQEPGASSLRPVKFSNNVETKIIPARTPTVQQMMSTSDEDSGDRIVSQGKLYYRVNHSEVTYHINRKTQNSPPGSLIDGGANGGFAGNDVTVIEYTDRYADITGIDEHVISNVPLATVAGKIKTTRGYAIGIFHQYAYHGSGHTIHSPHQMAHFGLDVDDKSAKLGFKQRIKTPDGYIIPLIIKGGLPYMPMTKPSKSDLDRLPQIFFTSDNPWDPSVVDHTLEEDDINIEDEDTDNFYEHYDKRVTTTGEIIHPDPMDNIYGEHFENPSDRVISALACSAKVKLKDHDYEALKPNFAWAPIEVIKKTLENTTQMFRNMYRMPLRKHFKSRFPAANVPRRNEAVATDTIMASVPAHMSGVKMAQIFVGRRTTVADVYPLRKQSDIPHKLEDNIRERGAMDCFISDGAKANLSNRINDLLRLYCIDDYQSEPHHQHQNYAENKIGKIKDVTNRLMARVGCPPSMWLLSIMYVTHLLNYLATESLNWQVPLQILWGFTPDASMFMAFHFWQQVFYAVDDIFPSVFPEKLGRIVGFACGIGDALTYQVLDDTTQELLYRSSIRPQHTGIHNAHPGEENSLLSDKPIESFIRLASETPDGNKLHSSLSGVILPDELIGRSFLLDEDEEGQRHRATIVKKIIEHDEANNKAIKFLVQVPEAKLDQLRDYHDLLDRINSQQGRDEDGNQIWKYISFDNHIGPLTSQDKRHAGSSYNILVKWEDGSSTYEPLHILAKDAPDMCAQYAVDHNLLDTDGWKQFKRRARNLKVLERQVNQAKKQHKRWAPTYMFGIEIPRDPKHARELDSQNGNTKWQDAEYAELQQLMDYNFAQDIGEGDKNNLLHHQDQHDTIVPQNNLKHTNFPNALSMIKIKRTDATQAYQQALINEKIYFNTPPTLRMLGIPIKHYTFMFGDRQSVITQATIPHSQLAKRHHALAYHYVRESVANGTIRFFHIRGEDNPADCLTKFLGYQVWYPLPRPILFWIGDTKDIPPPKRTPKKTTTTPPPDTEH